MSVASTIYNTLLWRLVAARARKRDGNRCTLARLVGGECSGGTLHVHHIVPLEDGGAPYDLENVGTVCASHHPVWEAFRRRLVGSLEPVDDSPPRCRHFHRTAEAREECERRMARAGSRSRPRVAA